MAPIFGYWDGFRGLGEPVRLVLVQAGQEYDQRVYKIGPAPDYDRSDWLNEKDTLGLDFPNLPYYIDGDVKITQLLAILRYLGQKYDLYPKPGAESIRSDIAEQAIMEIMLTIRRACYVKADAWEAAKATLLDYLPGKLEQTAQFLGDRKFILGDRVTYVDFLLYSTVDYIRCFLSTLPDSLQSLQDFLTRVEALPAIEKYIKSENFSRFPITAPMAMFGNQRE